MEKIKFFIGSDANSGCAECQMVLEYSIKKHCSIPYEIVWMKISDDPKSFWHGWNSKNWSTPFSGFRYGIAEYCDFEGKAIYQDDDQLWLTDPKELWDIEINDPNIMTGKKLPNGEIRHCVSLIDCEKYGRVVPPASRRKALEYNCEVFKQITFPHTQVIDGNFNNFDGEDQKLEDIKILHLTDMSSNPGVHMAIKRLGDQKSHWYNGPLRKHRRDDVVELFKQYHKEAEEDGFDINNYITNKKIDYVKGSQANYSAGHKWQSTEMIK